MLQLSLCWPGAEFIKCANCCVVCSDLSINVEWQFCVLILWAGQPTLCTCPKYYAGLFTMQMVSFMKWFYDEISSKKSCSLYLQKSNGNDKKNNSRVNGEFPPPCYVRIEQIWKPVQVNKCKKEHRLCTCSQRDQLGNNFPSTHYQVKPLGTMVECNVLLRVQVVFFTAVFFKEPNVVYWFKVSGE